MFALGATLAAILTGKPAFVGMSVPEVVGRAAQADLAGVRERLTNSGGDSELIALALECLSADVAQRPPDGHAVATAVAAYRAGVEARLKQAETERAEAVVREGEQRKRRRTVQLAGVVVAVVLLAGLSVSLWQMLRAQEERDAKDVALQAEQRARADETNARQQAFTALRSMTADVVEKKFTQSTVLTEDDRAFLRDIIKQFDAFAAIKGDDADSRALRAEGRFRVGAIRIRLGELNEATQDFDQAVSVYKQLAADFPTRAQFGEHLTDSLNNRANLLRATGRLKQAEQDYDLAVSSYQRLAADYPSRPELRQELANSHNNRGTLLRATGRLQEAEKDFDQAVSILRNWPPTFPPGPGSGKS